MSKTKCNICRAEVSLGEGGVVALQHKEWCPQDYEVDWTPDVPGAG